MVGQVRSHFIGTRPSSIIMKDFFYSIYYLIECKSFGLFNTNTGDDAINVVGPTAVRTACSLEKSSFICTFDSDADVAKQQNM